MDTHLHICMDSERPKYGRGKRWKSWGKKRVKKTRTGLSSSSMNWRVMDMSKEVVHKRRAEWRKKLKVKYTNTNRPFSAQGKANVNLRDFVPDMTGIARQICLKELLCLTLEGESMIHREEIEKGSKEEGWCFDKEGYCGGQNSVWWRFIWSD